MTPQELKNSILQMAIQGKLVEQRPEEGTAEELYQQIQAEKQHLIAEKKIKKDKPLPEITEDEKPFDIPESWKWVRWGAIVNVVSARRVHQSDWKAEGIPFYRAREIARLSEDGSIDNDLFISKELYKEFAKSGVPHAGDLMVTAVGTLGKCYIVKENDCFYYKDASVICFENYGKVLPAYLKYLMQSKIMMNQIKSNSSGTTVGTLTIVRMCEYIMPLPPLAEQKRIVAKIEELLPLIDRYEAAWTKLEALNKRFPEDMQKSILQEAIQGKLVEQRPEEGTAEELYQQIQAEKQRLIAEKKIKKDKPLPEITDDEKPFEIPESWKWVRFGDIYTLSNGTSSRGSKDGIDVPVLRLADLSNGVVSTDNIREIPLTEKEFRSHQLKKDDLIFIRVNGSKDRVASAFHYTSDKIISYCDHLFCGSQVTDLIDVRYVMFIFNSAMTRKQLTPEIKTTAGQNTISQSSMNQILIPLPPYAEQKRIVAKIEQLLPLCEKLQ